MRIILFGATGMVGRGVLEACLRDDAVTDVLVIGRSPTGRAHPKLHEVHHTDFTDFTAIQERLRGYDACFFCLGTSSLGMSETDYRTVTFDIGLAAAHAVLAANPELTFCYVSGAGTGTGSRQMWARVKGETENALLALTERAYMFRPALIEPLPGGEPKTKANAVLQRVLVPLYPLVGRIAPRRITSALRLGQAMIRTARTGSPTRILFTADINDLAAEPTPS
ncbi:NAD-dependent epimerase/dehydratase family protein [Nocardia sp. CA-136227]|uniref:NAD-dependent epimerase/dehydratase family protein n=1 Tax=Nocardia sp. CA-136227 TaxID=3239979 RepID=UPI003D989B61